MKIRKKLLILTFLLFSSLFTITGLSLWNWHRLQSLNQTILLGQQLQNYSQKVMGLMKDIIFDLFAPQMYGQIRSLTFAPRSVATYKTWLQAVDEYQLTFMDFVDDREVNILQDNELQDIYNTALTLNQKALDKLNYMSTILVRLQEMDLEGENLYNTMQKDESLIPFFQEFRDTSYYFTNTFESYMNHFFMLFRKQSIKIERDLYILFLLVSIFAGTLSVLYSLVISREILRKINLVGLAFQKISTGDFSTTYTPTDRDELSSLIIRINNLSSDLKENINSILNLTRDMGTALGEGGSRDDMMNLVTETIINDTSAECAAIYLFGPLEDQFVLQAVKGTDTQMTKTHPATSAPGRKLKSGKTLISRSQDPGGQWDGAELITDGKCPESFIAIPLIISGNVRGFLSAMTFTKGLRFSDLGITRMINFAEYVSLSIDNHTKYMELLEKREAEYNALQSQVQPHFIYNILNGFVGLNRMGDQKRLEKAILALREMLRYVTDQNRWTTLGEEIAFLRSYCDLQKIRFGDRLAYRFSLPAELESFRIPKLLLQPLVENSIIHGLEPLEEGGSLALTTDIYLQDNLKRIVLSLEDTGSGFHPDNRETARHVGLRNVKDRLIMAYPGSEFLIRSIPGRGTSIIITIVTDEEDAL